MNLENCHWKKSRVWLCASHLFHFHYLLLRELSYFTLCLASKVQQRTEISGSQLWASWEGLQSDWAAAALASGPCCHPWGEEACASTCCPAQLYSTSLAIGPSIFCSAVAAEGAKETPHRILQLFKLEKRRRQRQQDCCLSNTEALFAEREWLETLPPPRLVFTRKLWNLFPQLPATSQLVSQTLLCKGFLCLRTGRSLPPQELCSLPEVSPSSSPFSSVSRLILGIWLCCLTGPSPGCRESQDHLLWGGV